MVRLARKLGVFDAGLIVMGGIIGTGIFRNPSVVAQRVHSPVAIMTVWLAGGAIAILGAFLFAELAARRSTDGGLYGYLRDAFHPVVAFAYGWTLLLVSQSGGMAAAAVTFAVYYEPLTGHQVNAKILGAIVLAVLTAVNCFGVRSGGNVQNAFMLLKIAAIGGLIGVGFLVHAPAHAGLQAAAAPGAGLAAMGLAMIPVLFAYSGWQTSSFMTGELKNPSRTLPLGMLWGVGAVVALYVLVNVVSLRALGAPGLMRTDTPFSDILRLAAGPIGARVIAGAIALSTIGFLSNQILTSPRVYHAMANDGSFFRWAGWVHPATRVPVVSIALQGIVALVIALSDRYDQILNYVTSIDYLFFGFSAIALFIFRARDRAQGSAKPAFAMPGHPYTTALFLAVAWLVVLDTYVKDPRNSFMGVGILLAGVVVYFAYFARTRGRNATGSKA